MKVEQHIMPDEAIHLIENKVLREMKMFEIYYANDLYYLALFKGKYHLQMRYLTLVLMAIQCICVVLCMKLSVTYPASDGKQYLTPVAVVMGEILKLFTSLFMIFQISGGNSIKEFICALKCEFLYDIKGNLLIIIPGILFLFQNNLTYIALEHLPASVYQVTAQLKVLTTAIFSVVLLKRRLGSTRWFACFLLFVGVLLVQKSSNVRNKGNIDSFRFMIGFLASVTCSITSGLGSVIIEKVVKGSENIKSSSSATDIENTAKLDNLIEKVPNSEFKYKSTVWGRNVILSLIGIFGGSPIAWISCKEKILRDGIFQGFSWLTILVIFLNAYGGFIVIGVLKYSDSIMKCFFNALTIVLITILSWAFLGDSTPSIKFFIASAIVIVAVNIYTLNKVLPDSSCTELLRIFGFKKRNADFC
ncbi:UDP N-acetylglucosamine transporter-like nucleotide sugar transporter [Cryptosporidium ubiquitum]|uniref:UDP N-acetylglucosamine transporter-like nucleotide sugar transporter n=1 Tax=Cryptosporidium ubiquitum TaxID=857276 RepID=A0A1J4MCA1_9CRYT|nr:UDP N-acetylglucosamine transporter-like nucleotide sugar transporter [Cryptosporidium ubiquitum]OII71838.1 UDP N-acetylglucosamine transporter-like nucleotide sugar transporter [Cryptosporidium ubiquitum]